MSTAHLTYSVTTDTAHGPDQVFVARSDGRSWNIHREDADPEHRFIQYRLAAGWFGNLPAPVESPTLHEMVAGILEDREAQTAAAHVRDPDHEQDIFDVYFGPMLDEIQVEHDGNECSCSNPEASAMTGHGHGCDLYFQR